MAATPTFGSGTSGLAGLPGLADTERRANPIRLVEYDPELRRIWVAGQRLHHGATGSALAWAGVTGLLARRGASQLALLLAGGALMAHDWKDRSIWFQRGRQNQPPPERRCERRKTSARDEPRSFRLYRR